jgi:hypothetical protein
VPLRAVLHHTARATLCSNPISLTDGSVWSIADGRLMHFTGSSWENYSAAHGLASDGLYSLFFDRDWQPVDRRQRTCL